MKANTSPEDPVNPPVAESPSRLSTPEMLAASELRYRRLFESAKDGILILDAETGMVVDVNPFLIELLGFSRESFFKKKIWDLGCFEDIFANEENFWELQQNEYIRYDDKPLKTCDGRHVHVEFVSNVYLVNEQKVIQCNIRDITERRHSEEANARLATAADQAAETIVITDTKGTILYANPAFEKISGYTREEALGQNPRILKSGRQDAEFYSKFWEKLNSGEVWRGHLINKRKDGALYEEEVSISPVRDASNKVFNFVAVKRDITYEAHLESQLRQAQKMEAVGRLAGGVAHDFNNLLMGIMGYVELCQDEIEAGHPIREWLDEIMHISHRSAEITRQLLAFARKQVIAPKVLDLNDAVAGILKLLRQLIGEDIKLVWQPGADLKLVKIDPSQIDQILANLCLNARDASNGIGTITLETGNITITDKAGSELSNMPPGGYVFLTVNDNGSGIDSETLTHIFEPFFTTKDIGKGTGLGLATVYGIVKQNNGFIYAYSAPDQGTTFKIYLPQALTQTLETITPATEVVPQGHGETILLVEDEKSLRITCGLFLESFGYKVLSAENPEEAILLSGKHPGNIQLLLTDVVMPIMDGKKLAQQIRTTRTGIKVLFMSGYTPDVIAQRGVLEHDTSFIAKPFTRKALAYKVREVLDSPKSRH